MKKISIEDIERKVIEAVSESLSIGAEEITIESSLNETDMDSLSRIELLMELEEGFDIKISDEEAEKFQTVRDVIKYIKKTQEE